MQLPKLTPLQSRFAASLVASILLVIIYYTITTPKFAYAAELGVAGNGEARQGQDHNWRRIDELGDKGIGWDGSDEEGAGEDTLGAAAPVDEQGRVTLVRRAADINALQGSNIPGNLNIDAGHIQFWTFSNSSVWAPLAAPDPGLPSSLTQAEDADQAPPPKELRKRGADDDEVDGIGQDVIMKRQSTPSRTVYISINTCLQPTYNGTGIQTGPPPQLTLYVSSAISTPGPEASGGEQEVIPLDQGFANFSMSVDSNFSMAVSAPSLSTGFTGGWNYDIAASIDDYYHMATLSQPFLYLIDTDTQSALLVTENLTQLDANDSVYQAWVNLTPVPFVLFAQNMDDSMAIEGVKSSFCGLQTTAQIQANAQDPQGIVSGVDLSMITRGLDNKPKEQFYVKNLNGSSSYQGVLAIAGNSTRGGPGVVGGGGQVWQAMSFTTKSDGNCQLVFNLDFCDEVAYAVPSNPKTFPSLELMSAQYDSYAAEFYQAFNYSLQQVACNTTSAAQYSLAKTCDDCVAAYKQWLCAVTIPRCEDWTSPLPYLQKRNMGQVFFQNDTMLPDYVLQEQYNPMLGAPGNSVAQQQTWLSALASNSSRNVDIIDNLIMPGPYKELLPCDDLCYSLVQSCPASLGFGCPYPGRGLEVGYGKRTSNLTCSYLGAYYYKNDGVGLRRPGLIVGMGVLVSLAVVWIGW